MKKLSLFVIFGAICLFAGPALSHAQTYETGGTCSTHSGSACNFTVSVTSGWSAIVWVGNDNGQQDGTLSDTDGDKFSCQGSITGSNPDGTMCTIQFLVTDASETITYAPGGSQDSGVIAAVFTGGYINADQYANNTFSTGASLSVGPTPATTASNELAFACFVAEGSTTDTYAAGGGYTGLTKASFTSTIGSNPYTTFCEYKDLSSMGAQTATSTLSNSRQYIGQIFTFEQTIGTPTLSPSYGTFTGPTAVTFGDTTPSSTFSYCFDTTNACTPSTTGTMATVSSDGFLRVTANALGYGTSSVVSVRYAVTSACPSGYVNSAQLVMAPKTSLGNSLTQFPTLFTGNSALAYQAQGVTSVSGTDIIFCTSASGGAVIPYEKVSYASSTGLGEWWFASPLVNNTSTGSSVYVLWGKSGAADQSCGPSGTNDCGTSLWYNYKYVNHFGSSLALNSVDNSVGTNSGVTSGSGDIDGSGGVFNGGSAVITVGSTTSVNFNSPFTAEGLVKISATGIAQTIAASWSGSSHYNWLFYVDSSQDPHFIWSNNGSYNANTDIHSTGAISTGTWYDIAAVQSGSSASIYVNGVSSASGGTLPLMTFGGTGTLGWVSGDALNGTLDEVRVANAQLSATQLTADYLTETSSTFVTWHAATVPGLDTSKWYVLAGQGAYNNGCSWPEDFNTGGGALTINDYQQSNYCPGGTSAIRGWNTYSAGTISANTFNFQYGTMQTRVAMPYNGAWPAIWLFDAQCQAHWKTDFSYNDLSPCLPQNEQEIDLNDYLAGSNGVGSGRFNYCFYTSSYSCWQTYTYSFAPLAYNTYKLVWTSSSCTLYVNGSSTAVITPCATHSMYPLFDIFMTQPNSGVANSYPVSMQVDYIRICSKTDGTDCTVNDPTMMFQDEFGGTGTMLQNTKMQGGKVQG